MAPGDTLEGPKWASTTITYSFATSNAATSPGQPFSSFLTDGSIFDGDPRGLKLLATSVFDYWSSLAGLNFQQVADSTDPATEPDIRVGFGTLGSGQFTETNYAAADGSFVPGTQILLQDPGATPFGNAPQVPPIYQGTTLNLDALLFAEVGHAIGIAASSDLTSVLNPANAGNASTDPYFHQLKLSPSDIAAVQALHGVPLPAYVTQDVLTHPVRDTGPVSAEDQYRGINEPDAASRYGIPGGTVQIGSEASRFWCPSPPRAPCSWG